METSQAPKNVLQMMKDFAEETKLKDRECEEKINGENLVDEDIQSEGGSNNGSRSGSASSRSAPVRKIFYICYSCGLSTATIEYSCPFVCLSVCVSSCVSV